MPLSSLSGTTSYVPPTKALDASRPESRENMSARMQVDGKTVNAGRVGSSGGPDVSSVSSAPAGGFLMNVFSDNWWNALMTGGISMTLLSFVTQSTLDWGPIILGAMAFAGALGRVLVTWLQAQTKYVEAQARQVEADAHLDEVEAKRKEFELQQAIANSSGRMPALPRDIAHDLHGSADSVSELD